MRHRFSPRQFVTMVIAISLAVVLLPLVGGAASQAPEGKVIIVDRTTPSRSVRVERAGTLQVDARAGVRGGAFNVQASRGGGGLTNFASAPSNEGLAITEVTLSGEGPDPSATITVELEARVTAANNCSGGTSRTLRRVTVDVLDTLVLNFNGPPLFTPVAPARQRVCFGFRVVNSPNGSSLFVGATGYRFRP